MNSLIGYHGTKKEAVDAIAQNGFDFKPRLDHWLGDGFYFYEVERQICVSPEYKDCINIIKKITIKNTRRTW